jgi:hypothetical protein
VHVPLIVRWPGHVTPGEVRADLVSLVDLVPTALEMAGVPVPPRMHGRPFLGPNAERRECVFAARDRIEESVDRVRSVITDRHHYIRNFMPDRPAAGRIRAEWRESYNPGIVLLKQLHDEAALMTALEHGHKEECDTVILNGDTIENYGVSRWEPDPRRRNLQHELQTCREGLAMIRSAFPKADIYFKFGNHDDRLEQYLKKNAPLLLDVPECSLESLLKLAAIFCASDHGCHVQ